MSEPTPPDIQFRKHELVKTLSEKQVLEILEFISLSNYKTTTQIKDKFSTAERCIKKLVEKGLVSYNINLQTNQKLGWKVTPKGKDILNTIFATIENYTGRMSKELNTDI